MNALLADPLDLTISHNETVRGVAAGLWRVTDRRGLVLGNIRAVAESLGTRFHAVRFQPQRGTFVTVGEFWSPDEALSCLRYSR